MSAASMRRQDAVVWLADLASAGTSDVQAARFAGASRIFRTLTGLDAEQVQRLINAELRRRKESS